MSCSGRELGRDLRLEIREVVIGATTDGVRRWSFAVHRPDTQRLGWRTPRAGAL